MRRLSLGLIILILLQFAFGGQRSPQGNGNVTFWEDEDKEKNKPRTLSDIKSVISKLLATVQKGEEPAYEKIPSNTGKIIAGKMRKASLEAALAQLKIYRYLAGLPYKDIELNGEFSNGAQHAVVLMSILGRISHNPSKPADVPDDFFKIAFKGAASSNLAGGGESNLTTAINNWMSDSDKTNIDRLGHRRWLLNPSMKDVGFGFYNGFAAGWVVGGSRDSSPDYDFIAFPVPGFHPWTYFGTKWAWSVSINPKKYQKPEKGKVKVMVFPEKDGKKIDAPLRLDYENVSHDALGTPHCIIFRPILPASASSSTFIVEITGVKSSDGENKTISYSVKFVE